MRAIIILILALFSSGCLGFMNNDQKYNVTQLNFNERLDDQIVYNMSKYYQIECKDKQNINQCLDKTRLYVFYEFYEGDQLLQWYLYHLEIEIVYQIQGDNLSPVKYRKFPIIPLQGNNMFQQFNLSLAGQDVERFFIKVINSKEAKIMTEYSIYIESKDVQRLAYQLPFIQVDARQNISSKWFTSEIPKNAIVKVDLDFCLLQRDTVVKFYKNEDDFGMKKSQDLELRKDDSKSIKRQQFWINGTKDVSQDEKEASENFFLNLDYHTITGRENIPQGPNVYSLKMTIYEKYPEKDVWSYFKVPEKIQSKIVYRRTDDELFEIHFNGLQLAEEKVYPKNLKYILYEIHISDDEKVLPALTQCDLTSSEMKKLNLMNSYSIHYKFFHYVNFEGEQFPNRVNISHSQLFGDDLILQDSLYIMIRAIIELPEYPGLFDQYHILTYPTVEKTQYSKELKQKMQEFLNFHNEFILLEIIGAILVYFIVKKILQKFMAKNEIKQEQEKLEPKNTYNPIQHDL